MPTPHDDLLTRPSTGSPASRHPSPGGWTADSSSAPTRCWPGYAGSRPTTLPWRASCYSGSRAQHRARAPAATDRHPRPPPRMARRPSRGVRLGGSIPKPRLVRGAVLLAFCPTDPNPAARPRITLHDQSAWSPAEQGECDSAEPCRTEPDESHPAENRTVGTGALRRQPQFGLDCEVPPRGQIRLSFPSECPIGRQQAANRRRTPWNHPIAANTQRQQRQGREHDRTVAAGRLRAVLVFTRQR
jgi:hypothetical protein